MSVAPLNVPALLHKHSLRPNKRLGQNFLIDESALARVTTAAEIQPQHAVLEIGAGLGSLTRHLAVQARSVVAVELDGRLLPALGDVLTSYPNVRLVQGDILALNPAQLMPEAGYLVVANIPYYITSALICHLLEAQRKPERLVLTVQREVAERICAAPGDLSLLALSVQVYGHPRLVTHIPAGAFYPSPKVDSAVVRVDIYPSPVIRLEMLDSFFRLLKAGFSQKRKTLRNALSGGLQCSSSQAASLLEAAGIDPMRRAESLSLAEWEKLTQVYETQAASP